MVSKQIVTSKPATELLRAIDYRNIYLRNILDYTPCHMIFVDFSVNSEPILLQNLFSSQILTVVKVILSI